MVDSHPARVERRAFDGVRIAFDDYRVEVFAFPKGMFRNTRDAWEKRDLSEFAAAVECPVSGVGWDGEPSQFHTVFEGAIAYTGQLRGCLEMDIGEPLAVQECLLANLDETGGERDAG